MPGREARARGTRARALLLAGLVVALLGADVGVSRGDTASDLDAARRKLADTQAAANASWSKS